MRRSLACAAAVMAAALLCSFIAPAPAGAAPATEPGIEADFVAGINDVRGLAGLPSLDVHPELTAVAREWSATMAAENRIWHNANVGGQVSAPWVLIGENVGTGHDVPTLMHAFVDSASHYHNLVEPDYDWVGVGVTWGSDGRMYTAHVFMDLDGGVAPSPALAPAPAAAAPAVPVAPAATIPPPAVPAPPATVAPPAAAAPARVERVLAAVRGLGAGVA